MNDDDRAIADYTQALKFNTLDPQFTIASHYNRGNAYNRKGNYDLAIADYTQAIRLDSDNINLYINRRNAYLRKNDYDRAIADYEAALRIDPTHANARRSLEYARQQR